MHRVIFLERSGRENALVGFVQGNNLDEIREKLDPLEAVPKRPDAAKVYVMGHGHIVIFADKPLTEEIREKEICDGVDLQQSVCAAYNEPSPTSRREPSLTA